GRYTKVRAARGGPWKCAASPLTVANAKKPRTQEPRKHRGPTNARRRRAPNIIRRAEATQDGRAITRKWPVVGGLLLLPRARSREGADGCGKPLGFYAPQISEPGLKDLGGEMDAQELETLQAQMQPI